MIPDISYKYGAFYFIYKFNKMIFLRLLYIGCNHHVLEILLDAAWSHYFGDKKSKDEPYCKMLQKEWNDIDKKSHHKLPEIIDPEFSNERSISEHFKVYSRRGKHQRKVAP